MGKEYGIWVKGEYIPVDEQVYNGYYQEKEHGNYVMNKVDDNECSLEELYEGGARSIELRHPAAVDPETYIIQKERRVELQQLLDQALCQLSDEELNIFKVVCVEKKMTQSQYAKMHHISQQSVSKKIDKIRRKIKSFILF